MVEKRSRTKEQHRLSYHERCQIEEEIHGTNSMGFSKEEETKQHVAQLALEKLQEYLERTLLLDRQARAAAIAADNATPSDDDDNDGGYITNHLISTNVYELCLQRNFSYATREEGSLRLMCLRADLWNPQKACERFLRHLTILYVYYGEDGLRGPLGLQFLGGNNNEDVNNNLMDMNCLKSGGFSLLPSRDRSGRRVVFLQPSVSSTDTPQQYKELKAHSMFKAMLYFFSTIARRDIDAQRNGLVLILNSTMASTALKQDYIDFYQAIPIRFSVVHACCDNSDSTLNFDNPKAYSRFIGDDYATFATRIRVHEKDAGDNGTRFDLGTYGIPVHEIPVTATGIIKLKQHKQWIKIQEWFEQRALQEEAPVDHLLDSPVNVAYNGATMNDSYRSSSSFQDVTLVGLSPMFFGSELCSIVSCVWPNKIAIIECPATNDILFSRGGKFWNGLVRFQRGNLEFMDYLDDVLREMKAKGLTKNKKMILAVVEKFAAKNGGRFLVSATEIEGLHGVPEGCWVDLPLDSPMLMRKIHATLRNHDVRLNKEKPPKVDRRCEPPPPSDDDDDNDDHDDDKSCSGNMNFKKRKIVHSTMTTAMKKRVTSTRSNEDSLPAQIPRVQQKQKQFLLPIQAIVPNDNSSIVVRFMIGISDVDSSGDEADSDSLDGDSTFDEEDSSCGDFPDGSSVIP